MQDVAFHIAGTEQAPLPRTFFHSVPLAVPEHETHTATAGLLVTGMVVD